MDKRLQNEIAQGEKLASAQDSFWYWETPAGKERWQRRLALFTASLTPGLKVLEVGCGKGNLTQELVKTKARLVAMDISLALLKAAAGLRGDDLSFLCANAYELPLKSNAFDLIVGSSVLHHLDLDRALGEFYRILAKDGAIIFTEPNMLNPQIALEKNVPFIKKLTKTTPHETAFIRWRLKNKLACFGFKEIAINNFDFLHPNIPGPLVPFSKYIGRLMERLPLVREISGSLYIQARK